MALRRRELRQIGGFAALADYLADDYQLGRRIARNGFRVVLSPVVADCREAAQGWRQVWRHQLRWARTIRACRPAPYFFSILSNATLWPLLLLASAPRLETAGAAGLLILARVLMATALERRMLQYQGPLFPGWLAPLKDLLQAILWVMAFTGADVQWRGCRYRIVQGGKIVRLT